MNTPIGDGNGTHGGCLTGCLLAVVSALIVLGALIVAGVVVIGSETAGDPQPTSSTTIRSTR